MGVFWRNCQEGWESVDWRHAKGIVVPSSAAAQLSSGVIGRQADPHQREARVEEGGRKEKVAGEEHPRGSHDNPSSENSGGK